MNNRLSEILWSCILAGTLWVCVLTASYKLSPYTIETALSQYREILSMKCASDGVRCVNSGICSVFTSIFFCQKQCLSICCWQWQIINCTSSHNQQLDHCLFFINRYGSFWKVNDTLWNKFKTLLAISYRKFVHLVVEHHNHISIQYSSINKTLKSLCFKIDKLK